MKPNKRIESARGARPTRKGLRPCSRLIRVVGPERSTNIRVPWTGDRCVLCLQASPLSDEHVIPESLGGRLVVPFLCRLCNSSLGHRYEHAARSDPTVRLLVNELAEKIPAVAQFVGNNQAHMAVGPGLGAKKGYVKDGEFHISSTREPDGSLVQSTPNAKKAVDRMLQKEGYDAAFRADALARIDQSPENLPIDLTPTLTVVKWEIAGSSWCWTVRL